jgi:predicted transcriptional regulator
MPDGRSYFWIARTADSPADRYLGPQKSFAIGLGCDLAHADKLIYSAGIDVTTPDATVPIGAGCKICDRPACPQRASHISVPEFASTSARAATCRTHLRSIRDEMPRAEIA